MKLLASNIQSKRGNIGGSDDGDGGGSAGPAPSSIGIGGGVTYIAFVGTGSQPADMENIPEIQALGAQLMESLLDNNP